MCWAQVSNTVFDDSQAFQCEHLTQFIPVLALFYTDLPLNGTQTENIVYNAI